MARTLAAAGTCSRELGLLSPSAAGHRQWCNLLQGTDSGAVPVPVLHMESWPPGGACFGTTELHFVNRV